MGTRLRYILTILSFGLISFCSFSQNLDKVELSAAKDELSISVKVKDCKTNQTFFPTAEFYYENGERIGTSNIAFKSGNNSLGCGSSDVILWKPSNDNITINQAVYATVFVKSNLDIKLAPHVVKSLVFPGLGDYRLRNGNFYFMYGLAGYGLIASALVLQNKATQNYDSYKSSFDISESDNLYDKAVKQRNLSYVALASAAVVWTIDIASLTKKYKSVKLNPSTSNYYTALANKTFQAKSNVIHFDNRTDFDIAMDNGKLLTQRADDILATNENSALSIYQQAEVEYTKAVKHTESEKAKVELESVQQKISAIEQRQNKYNQLIADAEVQMQNIEYDKAQNTYYQALALYPDKEYPKSKIKEIENAKANQKIQNNYNDLIAKADRCLNEKKYDEAKALYNQALTLKTNEVYPKTQIENCEKLKVQSQYDAIIVKADAQFNAKNYEEAERLYNDALLVKTNESYPVSQIEKCKQLQKQNICDSYIQKANVAYNTKKYKEAKSYYEEAYAMLPSVEIKNKIDLCQQKLNDIEWDNLMQKANIAFANDDYETALKLYQQADGVKPNQPKTIEQIIECKKELKKTEEIDLVTLYEQCKKAVFFIISADKQGVGQGSGFFITSDGIAVTNYHVYSGDYWSMAKVYTEDGNSYNIDKVIASDKEKDYMIFKVSNNGHTFPTVKLASTQSKIGEKAFAIGNPEGLTQTLSEGIISAYRTWDGVPDDFLIQTTVGITHGSSGGALFNMKGEVIGITSAGFDDVASANLNFAINTLKISALNKYR